MSLWLCCVIRRFWLLSSGYSIFFFFQAEDGIRDYKVTGVQTCALPILRHRLLSAGRSPVRLCGGGEPGDRKSTRLNSSHLVISYAVFCLKKKKKYQVK